MRPRRCPRSSRAPGVAEAPTGRGSRLAAAALALALAAAALHVVRAPAAQAEPPPFGLPFAEPPGPDTWLLLQPYGNTTLAYVYRQTSYGAGQGMHFGVDFLARCGTTVVAIGDGVVAEVDNRFRGAGPHNLLIDHPNGYTSLYGHLLARPRLEPGQLVQRGDPVGVSGDPDRTCFSRPHLHLEIRDRRYRSRAYNPALLIDADWDRLALVGAAGFSFQRDLDDPRRWQDLLDQPPVYFGGLLLNEYANPWPPDG